MEKRTNKFTPRRRRYLGREELRGRPFFKRSESRNQTPQPSLYDTASFKQTFTPLADNHTFRIGITNDQGDRPIVSPRVARASRARAYELSRSSYKPFRKESNSTSTFLNGTGSRKRRIDDTEFDLVAAEIGAYSTQGSIVISPRGRAGLEDEFDPTNSTLPMLGTISFIGSFGRMVLNFGANLGATFTGLKETWRRYRTGNPYTIAEFRSYINNNQISNKRIKLDHDDDDEFTDHQEPVKDDGLLRWVGADELLPLKNQFTTLESRLRITSQLITDFPSRQSMHKVLEPIADVLTEDQDELALSSTDDHHDLCKLFHLRWQETFDLLRQLYDIELIVRIRNKFEFVPQELDLCHAQAQASLARRARKLLSTPMMIATCNQVLRLAQDPNAEVSAIEPNRNLSQSFIDQVILDLNAVLRKLPPPSYVKNKQYRAKLERMFSRGGGFASLPGTFPELDQSGKLSQHSSWEPSSIPLPPSPSPSITRPSLSEEEAFHLVRDSHVTDAYSRSPLDPAGFVTVKSILKKKLRDGSSPFSPKRLAKRCAKAVRFTSDTLSPRPRSHKGSELNQLRLRNPSVALNRPLRPNPVLQPPADSLFRHTFNFPIRPSPLKVDHDAKIREIFEIPSLDLELSDTSRAGIELQKEEEQRRIAEEARRVAEEQQRVAEEKARRELEERLSRSGGLRVPSRPFVGLLGADWQHRARDTLRAANTAVLAKTGEGIDLRRHDFAKVVAPAEWLNDEIVNGSLNWLDQAINSAAGIKDVKKTTRKCLAMSSFFFKRLQDQGVKNTQRTLRRFGVEKRNFLDVNTILLPICERSHWTLLVIRPSKRTIAHMDSMNPHGSRAYTNLAAAWIKDVLEEQYKGDEWRVMQHDAPMQTNGHDCGVHTITNGMCLALGLSPVDCYTAEQMPQQRLRIASMLLNGGFNGEFDLRVY